MEEKIKCYIYTIRNRVLVTEIKFSQILKFAEKSLIFLCGREIFICGKVILNSRNAKDQKTNNYIDDWLTSIVSKSRWYCYGFVQGPSFDFQRIWWRLFWRPTKLDIYSWLSLSRYLCWWNISPDGIICHASSLCFGTDMVYISNFSA